MQGFIFGGDTGTSYDALQAKRRMAEQLGLAALQGPQNVGQGLSALGAALAYRRLMGDVTKGEQAGRAQAESALSSLFGGALAAPQGPSFDQPIVPQAPAPDPNNPQGIAGDTMRALGLAPDAAMIRAKLVERGLPEHVADGFVMNFQDESGLNPGINEAAPLVPGSRGGFGLAQWTGPRRVALEKFAAERGVPVDNVDLQLDFLMTELQGPEAAAWSKIAGAKDPGSAAAAIATNFLRPAREHLDRRVAEYTGGQPAQPDMAQLVGLANNPYLNEGERSILGTLLQQRIQASDPAYQLDLEMKRAQLEDLRSSEQATLDQRKALAAEAGLAPGTPAYQMYIATGSLPTPTGDTGYGLTPVFGRDEKGNLVIMQIGENGTAVRTEMPEGVLPVAPEQLAQDKAKGAAVGKATGESLAAAATQVENADIALKGIEDILNNPALERGTGMSSVFNAIPGTKGYGFQSRVDQLKGGAFLTAIQQLQGMGALSNAEGATATAAIARLDSAQTTEDFVAALKDYQSIVQRGRDRAAQKMPQATEPAQSITDDELFQQYGLTP
ncbi:MAG: phage tail tip lysozyme [Paracoccaceae bacterium]